MKIFKRKTNTDDSLSRFIKKKDLSESMAVVINRNIWFGKSQVKQFPFIE